MHVDPAAILALIAEQQARIMHLSEENQSLRQQIDANHSQGNQP